MATILFSGLTDGAVVAFDPLADTLLFDDVAVGAASLAVSYAGDFTAVGFSAAGLLFTLTPTAASRS